MPDSSRHCDCRASIDHAGQLLQFGKTLYHQGDLSYFEAVNKDTLKNAYQRFEFEGMVLVSRSKDPKTPPRMRLAPAWAPSRAEDNSLEARGQLWQFAERISLSRREGCVPFFLGGSPNGIERSPSIAANGMRC